MFGYSQVLIFTVLAVIYIFQMGSINIILVLLTLAGLAFANPLPSIYYYFIEYDKTEHYSNFRYFF